MRSVASAYHTGYIGLLLAILATTLPTAVAPPRATAQSAESFVEVADGRFVLNGEPYYFAGTNFWFGMDLGADGPTGDRERLVRELDHMAELGIRNLRVMAASEGPNTEPYRVRPAVQPSPRVVDESLLRGLDFLLAEMARRDMKAVLVLNNFFQWSGGMAQYVSWVTGTDIPYPATEQGGASWDDFQRYSARFYGLPEAQSIFLTYIHSLVHRTNSLTGVRYRDDPTIMAWQLANEPRGFDHSDEYVRWIERTTAFIKLIDGNHLVSLGGEGKLNPYEATRFEHVASLPNLDYLTIHIWIENWGWYEPARPGETFAPAVGRAMGYLADHVRIADRVDKPIVLEEFGVSRDGRVYTSDAPVTYRDRFLRMMHAALYKLATEGAPVGGSNVWSWAGSETPARPGEPWQPGEPLVGDPPHEVQGWYSIYDADTTTLGILSHYAEAMAAIGAGDIRKPADWTDAADTFDLPSADDVRAMLNRHVLDAFYPRAIDWEYGGFLSSFAHDWTTLDNQDKFIVTQARHVWLTARASESGGDDAAWYRLAADQGAQFIRETMWDPATGGFRSLIARDGSPIEGSDPFTQGKTAYGNAFAIYALAAHHDATGDNASLSMARNAFEWMDDHMHDADHGGYFQFVDETGSALTQGWGPHPAKDQNSSIHILEAFTELYRVWPDDHLRSRLQEMLRLVRDTMVTEPGVLQLFFEADWTPISYRDSTAAVREANYSMDHVSFGHDVETAWLMLEAARVLNIDPAPTRAVARRMVDHAIRYGIDPQSGGLYNAAYYTNSGAGKADQANAAGPPEIVDDGRTWWAQAEALNTFLVMAEIFPGDAPRYLERFGDMWSYISTHVVDPEHGGWYQGGVDVQPEFRTAPKASIWKAGYHDGRALMNVLDLLEAK